ncbi:hypothetical protein [Corynebacterium casei]|uniref:hypothetical protein n=1 Tax=Corynebacterium casei TaxID=160386 RepID=UPI003FD40A52
MAAENALTMHSAGMRKNGRWSYGGVISDFSEMSANERNYYSNCGLILDILGRDSLQSVARGDEKLLELYQDARQEKERIENAERLKVEAAREEEEREAYAADSA